MTLTAGRRPCVALSGRSSCLVFSLFGGSARHATLRRSAVVDHISNTAHALRTRYNCEGGATSLTRQDANKEETPCGAPWRRASPRAHFYCMKRTTEPPRRLLAKDRIQGPQLQHCMHCNKVRSRTHARPCGSHSRRREIENVLWFFRLSVRPMVASDLPYRRSSAAQQSPCPLSPSATTAWYSRRWNVSPRLRNPVHCRCSSLSAL